ncbi:MAG: TRAP transporter large permease subunit [Rhodospirillaceae bacterium]|nr:TRAP transporter large permease subunit [Rhodospirillaceae bacterium]MBT4117701.1 TRAP transporter large permease subunit [Rhodospirillaceae bacterium]MBT4674458.1 TRAP transporter large permease subunit [Rhodospirillaceae bacterium]MBT4751160.1 TRAP transporter large permease subunit [Rhodospirillaceae bacterium]MBT5181084.1 TRAP transporter large permease subunit [Rhodospirillaceae bacterium]
MALRGESRLSLPIWAAGRVASKVHRPAGVIASLFASVVFDSWRLNVETEPEEMGAEMAVVFQDVVNLIMIVVPIATVVTALINGLSPSGSGLVALFVLIPLSFINPAIRRNPLIVISALAHGGQQFARIMVAIAGVGIIVAVLGSTGLSNDFGQLVRQGSGDNLFLTLAVAGWRRWFSVWGCRRCWPNSQLS